MPSRNDLYPPCFASYVNARHEKHVALILAGKGYECFMPHILEDFTQI
jgi:hypothetical protein